MARDPKDNALKLAMTSIERQFGKGAIMRLGDEQAPIDIQTISTGCIGVDEALGMGGLPKGRITEIYDLRVPVRPPSLCMSWRTASAAWQRLSTPSIPRHLVRTKAWARRRQPPRRSARHR